MGTWIDQVDAFITLSDFQRDLMIEAGLPPERVYVKPNFYPGNPAIMPWEQRRNGVTYVGRLTAEKGVESLAAFSTHAWGTDGAWTGHQGLGPGQYTYQTTIDNFLN